MGKKLNLTNQKFGRLTAKRELESRNSFGNVMWECVCSCGKIVQYSSKVLRCGDAIGCGNHFDRPKKDKNREFAVWKKIYCANIKANTKRRKMKFLDQTDISLEQFIELSKQKCYYCNCEGNNITTDRIGGKLISNTIVKYIGLDRIDNNIGYLLSNVVPCYKKCNWSKGSMTQKEFKRQIQNIYNHWAKNE